MATIENGILGGFSGKAGPIVGYQRLGKWVIRQRPSYSAKMKQGSELQRVSRALFTKAQVLLSPVLDLVRIGFKLEAKARQITAHNAAKSYQLRNAFTENGDIEFSKVAFCRGSLPLAASMQVERLEDGIKFTWSPTSIEKDASHRDQVMLIAYDNDMTDQIGKPKPKAYSLLSGARRYEGEEVLKISEQSRGHCLHTYMAFISDDREFISNSVYLGEICY